MRPGTQRARARFWLQGMPADRWFTVNEIAQKAHVSMTTVRNALKMMQAEGWQIEHSAHIRGRDSSWRVIGKGDC